MHGRHPHGSRGQAAMLIASPMPVFGAALRIEAQSTIWPLLLSNSGNQAKSNCCLGGRSACQSNPHCQCNRAELVRRLSEESACSLVSASVEWVWKRPYPVFPSRLMFPCRRYTPLPLDRRCFLRQAGCGFGAVALTALLSSREIDAHESATDNPHQPH